MEKSKVKRQQTFMEPYPGTELKVINRKNYMEFLMG
jgi:hypothetical protein